MLASAQPLIRTYSYNLAPHGTRHTTTRHGVHTREPRINTAYRVAGCWAVRCALWMICMRALSEDSRWLGIGRTDGGSANRLFGLSAWAATRRGRVWLAARVSWRVMCQRTSAAARPHKLLTLTLHSRSYSGRIVVLCIIPALQLQRKTHTLEGKGHSVALHPSTGQARSLRPQSQNAHATPAGAGAADSSACAPAAANRVRRHVRHTPKPRISSRAAMASLRCLRGVS